MATALGLPSVTFTNIAHTGLIGEYSNRMNGVRISSSIFRISLLVAYFVVSSNIFGSDRVQFGSNIFGESLPLIFSLLGIFILVGRVSKRHRIRRIEILFLFLAITPFILVPIFSYIHYQQPILWGFIEARRYLHYFSFFLMLALFERWRMPFSHVQFSIIFGSFLIMVIVVSFGVEGVAEARSGRYSAGGFYLLVGALVAFHAGIWEMKRLSSSIFFLFLSGLIVTFMLYVTQTRSLLFGILIGFVIILINTYVINRRKSRVMVSILAVLILALPLFLMIGVGVSHQISHLLGGGQGIGLSETIRLQTISQIFDTSIYEWFFPRGALASQWDGGFAKYYGPNFFLSDVGLFGTIFTFGLPLALTFYAVLFRSLWLCRNSSLSRSGGNLTTTFVLVFVALSAINPIFEARGMFIAMLAAACLACPSKFSSSTGKENRRAEV